jgi:hypothetical protein
MDGPCATSIGYEEGRWVNGQHIHTPYERGIRSNAMLAEKLALVKHFFQNANQTFLAG